MKIMLIDRDRESQEQVDQLCQEMANVDLQVELARSSAIEKLKQDQFDVVLIDPAPRNDDLRTYVIEIRRSLGYYVPIIALSSSMTMDEAIRHGVNNFIAKPLSADDFKDKVQDAYGLSAYTHRLEREEAETLSREGIVSKSAFNQIYRSCLERADRSGDEAYVMFATVDNIGAIKTQYGADVAQKMGENLRNSVKRIRRLSDIAGQTDMAEICLMIIRPRNADEPMMAVQRFADSMKEFVGDVSEGQAKAVLNVSLMQMPTGHLLYSKNYS